MPEQPLPEEAYAAALAALDHMTPRRLLALVRSGVALERLWGAISSGRPSSVPVLARLGSEVEGLGAVWQRSAAVVDLGALWARCRGQSVLVFGRDGYPGVLADDPFPPAVLFCRGDPACLAVRTVAVVGTRNATAGGMEFAARLGRELSTAGVSVVSGLAKGIDGAAHRGALATSGGAPPIGVVASGLDVVYPRQHAALWEEVAARGVLCAEVPPGTAPSAHRFPARNRILAGLAEVVVVVESRYRGGSLLTVNEAGRRGVPVLAVPGSVRSPASEGTNLLLVDGVPPVIETLDVLIALGLEQRPSHRRRPDRRPAPDPADRALLDLFGTDALTLDTLVLRADRPLPDVAVALGRLEGAGWITRAGGWFERTGVGASASGGRP
jgi:DNA processing protein